MKRILKYLVYFLAILLIVSNLLACNGRIERSEYTNRQRIYEESQSIIAEELLYPPSAVFPEFESAFVLDNGEEIVYEDIVYHTYTVTAYVDSQNAFGAMLRSEYQVIIGLPLDYNWDYVYYEVVYLE